MKDFIESNHRNPSRYRIEEHLMLSFLKHNHKRMNADALKEERRGTFLELLEMRREIRAKNQYQ